MKKLTFLLAFSLSMIQLMSQEKKPFVISGQAIRQGIELHNEGKFKEAIETYRKISRNDTNYVWALYELGLSYAADSQYVNARKVLEEGIALDFDREREPELFNSYGSLLDDMGEQDRALRVYDSAILKYPSFSPLLLNKATTLLKMNKAAAAETLLQQNLVMDPYSYSSHYMLGLAAMQQGKVIPAFMSYLAYLMMSPGGKYQKNSINVLSLIARNSDEIQPLIQNRTENPNDNFALLEQIVLSKIALDKNYKPLIKLDDPICRQIQVIFEKLEYNAEEKDFWMQYYVPLFIQVFKEQRFETFVYHIFSDLELDAISSYNKKNKKLNQELIGVIVDYVNKIRDTRMLNYTSRTTSPSIYLWEDGRISGKGMTTTNGEKNKGPWEYYYQGGNLKTKGAYNDNGEREGQWNYYYPDGQLKAIETFSNGVQEGKAGYFFENGNPSSTMQFHLDQLEGNRISYYQSGTIRTDENYLQGKLNGKRIINYPNGMLHYVEEYKNDSLHGNYESYYQNKQLEYKTSYSHGALDGSISGYHENGNLSFEGQYSNGKTTGTWKRYHDNKQPKSVEHYENDLLTGEYKEFHYNGTNSVHSYYENGKTTGETIYTDEDGKKYALFLFENDRVVKATYFDKNGAIVSSSALKNGQLQLINHDPFGKKKSELTYNQNGQIEGEEKSYSPSGKLTVINNYSNGSLNGTTTGFFNNGNKKFELPYVQDKKDGFFIAFYQNGKPEQEGWYKENLAEGEWYDYDEPGHLRSVTSYYNDELDGWKQEFWPNGKLQSETAYSFGWIKEFRQFDTTGKLLHHLDLKKHDGLYYTLHFNGNRSSEGYYKKGGLDGSFKTYFFDKSLESSMNYQMGLLDGNYEAFHYGGKTKLKGQYKLGKKTGLWSYFDENGIRYLSEIFEDGQLNGNRTYYHENGRIETEIPYVSDERSGYSRKYDSTGTLEYELHFTHDLPVGYSYWDLNKKMKPEIALVGNSGKVTTYYPNGKVSSSFEYVDGKLVGDNLFYYQNGQLMSSSTENYSLSEGPSKEFYQNGKLKSEITMSNNNAMGLYSKYYSNGQLKEQGYQYNDLQNGEVKFFDEKGKWKESRIFYYGVLIAVKK